jgi:hypothetical protein
VQSCSTFDPVLINPLLQLSPPTPSLCQVSSPSITSLSTNVRSCKPPPTLSQTSLPPPLNFLRSLRRPLASPAGPPPIPSISPTLKRFPQRPLGLHELPEPLVELQRLDRVQNRHHLPQRLAPQPVRLLQQALQALQPPRGVVRERRPPPGVRVRVGHLFRVRGRAARPRPRILPAQIRRDGPRGKRLRRHCGLRLRQLARQLFLEADCLLLRGAERSELAAGQRREGGRLLALQQRGQALRGLHADLGVDEQEHHRGPEAPNPAEGPLKGGAPQVGRHVERVTCRQGVAGVPPDRWVECDLSP